MYPTFRLALSDRLGELKSKRVPQMHPNTAAQPNACPDRSWRRRHMHRNTVSKAAGLALALSVCGSSADGVAASRDWTKHPAIIQLDTTEDVFAIGDAHGDPQRLSAVLTAAKLMDAAPSVPGEVKWTGGRAVLVITGDMIDKGKNSIGVIKLVRALQSDAANNGGRVIITMGNHEAEFLA